MQIPLLENGSEKNDICKGITRASDLMIVWYPLFMKFVEKYVSNQTEYKKKYDDKQPKRYSGMIVQFIDLLWIHSICDFFDILCPD